MVGNYQTSRLELFLTKFLQQGYLYLLSVCGVEVVFELEFT